MTFHSKHEDIEPEDIVYRSTDDGISPYMMSVYEDQGILNQKLMAEATPKPIKIKVSYDKNIPIITQSLIKDLFYKGEELPYCPHRFYHRWILKDYVEVDKLTWMQGRYGETLILGGSSRGQSQIDLPRKKNGTKTIDQERIEIQAERAKRTQVRHNITIWPGINTQVLIKKVINGVLCQGEIDLGPTKVTGLDVEDPTTYFDSIIDTKFTGNMKSTFGIAGRAGWGDFDNMDHTQPYMYLDLIKDIDYELNDHLTEEQRYLLDKLERGNVMFLYWVFDYKVPIEELDDKFFGVIDRTDKRKELYEVIRKTVSLIEYHNELQDWDKCVQGDYCSSCTITECIFKNKLKTI